MPVATLTELLAWSWMSPPKVLSPETLMSLSSAPESAPPPTRTRDLVDGVEIPPESSSEAPTSSVTVFALPESPNELSWVARRYPPTTSMSPSVVLVGVQDHRAGRAVVDGEL